MMNRLACAVCIFLLLPLASTAQTLVTGSSLPPLHGVDSGGHPLNTADYWVQSPAEALPVLLLFRIGAGDDLANKLRMLDENHDGALIRPLAIGVGENAASLESFRERMGIRYPIFPSGQIEEIGWLKEVSTLPVTLVLSRDSPPRIDRIISGSGTAKSALLTEIAEQLFQQRRAEAIEIVELALSQGESPLPALEIQGYALLEEGRLVAAEAAFKEIESLTGQAAVALKRGDMEQARKLAEASADPFARTVLVELYLLQGRTVEPMPLLEGLQEQAHWKQSRILTLQGRAAEAAKAPAQALDSYQQAARLNPYDPAPLTNMGMILEERGAPEDLKEAESILRQAARIQNDPLAAGLLRHIERIRAEQADMKRAERIRAQITALRARLEARTAGATAERADLWNTAPLQVAVVNESDAAWIFPRAGYGVVVREEIEQQLESGGIFRVTERDLLLPILNELGIAEVGVRDSDQRTSLGNLLSLSHFLFLNYTLAGPDRKLHLRLVNTGSTEIEFQSSISIDLKDPLSSLPEQVDNLNIEFAQKRELRGRIVAASGAEIVQVDLGERHGLRVGDKLTVLEREPKEGESRRRALSELRPIAHLRVNTVQDYTAECVVLRRRNSAPLTTGMHVARPH
jgi:tetratricopeptide (TPR) repeat protein